MAEQLCMTPYCTNRILDTLYPVCDMCVEQGSEITATERIHEMVSLIVGGA